MYSCENDHSEAITMATEESKFYAKAVRRKREGERERMLPRDNVLKSPHLINLQMNPSRIPSLIPFCSFLSGFVHSRCLLMNATKRTFSKSFESTHRKGPHSSQWIPKKLLSRKIYARRRRTKGKTKKKRERRNVYSLERTARF